ncbi:M1 family metallopeptidase [Clostridioides sp. ZZV15-6383]|uniref:M1 family metallopeptidase n=1 Tax=Clostridioides sp. ZZV15-6383 TaxID=2811498 RepID=UPI001D110EC8|nr:M1 family metallopeptidase [Clostridioides sp. ZZV15-6383]
MVIKFNQKVRRTLSVAILFMVLIIGCFIEKDDSLETFKEKTNSKINQYNIDVIFDDETKRLMCNQSIEYINNTKSSIDKIYFHIYPNAFSKKDFAPFEKHEMTRAYPNGFNEGYIDIKNILNNNSKMEYKIKGDKNDILEIELGKELKPNERTSLDIKYNVKIPNSVGRFGYGENTINVTNWFPIACVNDERGWNLKSYETIGDPFYSETSDFHVKLLIPNKYKIAHTGKLVNDKHDSKKMLYEIEAENVRDFAFILSSKFDVNKVDSRGVAINTYNLNKKFSKKATEVAKDSINIFSELFGKYPYKEFSVVASDFFIGGMEYPMLVMIDQSLYNEKNEFLLEYVIAHETAHQWWYSAVGNDEISEPWLDEALTEYSTIVYFEQKYGKEIANKLIKTMEIQTKSYLSENIFKPANEYKNSTEYSLNVYTKGAIAFNEIRKEVGDKVFFETLNEYYNKYKHKNVNGRAFVELWNSKGVDINKIISEYK